MRRMSKSAASVLVSLSLIASSTAAVAAPAAAPQVSPWAVLSVTSGGAPAAEICGTAAAQGAANCALPRLGFAQGQTDDRMLPPQSHDIGGIPIPVLVILLAVLATGLYIAFDGDEDNANSPT